MIKPQGTYLGKRCFDLLLLAISAPITVPLGVAAASAVRCVDGPPVLFKQPRAGLNGDSFYVLKFRTMNDNRDISGRLLPDHARLTRVGRILRRTSLDELPQLINVLRGEMSIVGPRPLYLRYIPHYTERERLRLSALPGITGLAQVSGRNSAGWRDRLELDAQYSERPSLWKDIQICLQTAIKVIKSEGVSIIAGDSGDPLDRERSYPSLEQCHLRRLYPRDLPTRVKWMNDERVRRHMTLPDQVTLQATERWFAGTLVDSLRYEFVVEDERGRVVAMTGLRARRPGDPYEFYIFVDPERHGKGIGRVATELTLEQAQRTSSISAITLTVSKQNSRALRIYESLGFIAIDSDDVRIRMTRELEKTFVAD